MTGSGKHVVIIVSAGRTGTRFFGDFLSSMVPGSHSVHEPDVFEGFTRRTWERVRTFGIYHMVLGRLFKTTGLRHLSEGFLGGSLELERLIEALARQRLPYYEGWAADPIIESYYQWYGILPALPRVFPLSKVLATVRDPRAWVTSWMSFGAHHGPRDLVRKLGFRRLDPAMVGDAALAGRWPEMSRFERLCWTWRTVNGLILDFVDRDPNARLWRYEDLFLSEARERHLEEMLVFLTRFPDRDFGFVPDPALLGRRVHASRPAGFPNWPDWSEVQARQLDGLCGPLMRRLGYGEETDWRAKLGLASAAADPRGEVLTGRL